jgi:Kelch motif
MANKTEFTHGQFTVGVDTQPPAGVTIGRRDEPPQSFTIWIKSASIFNQSISKQLSIIVVASIGEKAENLFQSVVDKDGHKIALGTNKDQAVVWKPKEFPGVSTYAWEFAAEGKLNLKQDERHDVAKFRSFTYSSTADVAKIDVTLKLGNDKSPPAILHITKLPAATGTPVVVAFNVTPYPARLNRPVELKWKVIGLDTKQTLSLVEDGDRTKREQVGSECPLPPGVQNPGKKVEIKTETPKSFKLQVLSDGGQTDGPTLASLTVTVVKSGWDKLGPTTASLSGSDAPLLFHNIIKAGDHLYAIAGPAQGEPALYVCGTSLDWRPAIQDTLHPLPAGFHSSPAVWFDDKFWLVGGSAYDTAYVSSKVWVGTQATDRPAWSWQLARSQPGWPERMGHSALVFDGKLWVIGGYDGEGNSFEDAHYYDTTLNTWTECKNTNGWHGGCLMGAAAFEGTQGNKLYLHGGRTQPLSVKRYSDVWTVSKGSGAYFWKGGNDTGLGKENRLTVGSCLVMMGNEVYLLATFYEDNKFLNEFYKTGSSGKWAPVTPAPNLGRTEPFHLLAVEHDNRLVVRALGETTPNEKQTGLFVYTP